MAQAELADRWRLARAVERAALVDPEGEAGFERYPRQLASVRDLAHANRVARFRYVLQAP